MPNKTPKRRFAQSLRIGHAAGTDVDGLRSMARRDPVAFTRRVGDLVDKGDLRLSHLRDLRGLWGALADVQVDVQIPDAAGYTRAVTASAFPILMGNVVVAAINEAYDQVPTVGEQLVTELDDDKAVTVIARIAEGDADVAQVKEGAEYPEIGASEDSVEIPERPNGRRISMTATALRRNDVSGFVERVNALGRIAAETVEELTLDRVTDVFGSGTTPAAPYVYRPEGSGTSLFSASANTPGTRAPSGTRINSNALADHTELDAAVTRMRTMRNDRNKPIPISPQEMVALVPPSLESSLYTIKNSELIPGSANNDLNMWGPRGQYAGWTPVVGTMLALHDTAAWYYGAPRRQFRRKWSLRFEYVTLGQETESYLTSSIAFQARVAWNCEVGATDYVYWVQSLPASTAPSKS